MACYIVLGGFHNVFQNNFILNGIKVRVFFGKNIKKKHLGRHDKNYYYFCKSNIPIP